MVSTMKPDPIITGHYSANKMFSRRQEIQGHAWLYSIITMTLQEHHCSWSHWHLDFVFTSLFRLTIKQGSKFRIKASSRDVFLCTVLWFYSYKWNDINASDFDPLRTARRVWKYRKVSNIRRTLEGNKIVDHSDVVGASPIGAAPTTSSFST